jgi:hypothetical protein
LPKQEQHLELRERLDVLADKLLDLSGKVVRHRPAVRAYQQRQTMSGAAGRAGRQKIRSIRLASALTCQNIPANISSLRGGQAASNPNGAVAAATGLLSGNRPDASMGRGRRGGRFVVI